MLSDQDIFNRYLQKQSEFSKQADISLIGHSLFDMWYKDNNTLDLFGKSVANLGISGVSTRQYLDVLIKNNCIKSLGKRIFIFLGVNDICKEPEYSPRQVMNWLSEIHHKLRNIAPQSQYYLLEATPVNQISTVTNQQITELNQYIKQQCPQNIVYISTNEKFSDTKGELNMSLSTDGLHFNAQGYKMLRQILQPYLAE